MTLFLIDQLLDRAAREFPNHTALELDDKRINYAELHESATRLARGLSALGLHSGDRVGLCFRKSSSAVAAIYGILKAGAAYVPLDPLSPPHRLQHILEDCQVRAVIALESLVGRLPQKALAREVPFWISASPELGKKCRRVGEGWLEWTELPQGNLPIFARTELDLAYILYTSGSTGKPKGVMLSHRAALSFIQWAHDCFELQPEDRVSNHAPFEFDLSIFDLFSTCAAGATLLPVPEELSAFPRNLAQFIRQSRITIWYSVPAVLVRLLSASKPDDLASLRRILFAGEVFPTRHLRRLQESVPAASLHNLYGPTETNVCTYFEVKDLPASDSDTIPIGQPCQNCRVWVEDVDGKKATRHDPGEILVAGPSLMEGYWNDLAASQRVLGRKPGPGGRRERFYRTGDLGFLSAQGNIHFVGRKDNLVKCRGYRIELGEVEAALLTHPDVEEAAAYPVSKSDEKVLAAAVVPVAGRSPNPRELVRRAAQYLPPYMLPEELRQVDSLPRTSSGKIDRKRLAQEQQTKGSSI